MNKPLTFPHQGQQIPYLKTPFSEEQIEQFGDTYYWKLTDEEKSTLRCELTIRYQQLMTAASKCAGSLYPGIYRNRADKVRLLLEKILGKDESISKEKV